MTKPTKEQQQAFAKLQALSKSITEGEEMEDAARKAAQRHGLFGVIPEDAKSLYIHLSHKISEHHPFVTEIQANYGIDNVLVTIAPPVSGQSFYDNHLDESAKREKTKRVIEPFEQFSARKSIDAIIYLCNYLCDGYQSPLFPQDVETAWHIWRPIRLAEQLQKPLIVGYRQNFCFTVDCYERGYVANREKIKCPTTIVKI